MARQRDDIETVDQPGPQHVPVRRRPDLVRFLVTGTVLGAVLGGLIGWLGPDAYGRTQGQEVVLLAVVGALLLGLVAAVAYLVADRSSLRGQD
ncbi:hypothetical protein ACQE98_15040 [Ornithinimicrobium sp. W1679]|uniref:hypothetical protein n=1 Tax=unclassified Ornithinimicrobium TaxID=2615080 RepID=UPI003CF93AB8